MPNSEHPHTQRRHPVLSLAGTVTGKTKAQVKDKLDTLQEEIRAGVHTPATYTMGQCVSDWLDSLTLDPGTIASC